MKKRNLTVLSLLLITIIFAGLSFQTTSQCKKGKVGFIILVHDVSPVYISYLQNITKIIQEYGLQSDTYLLIIPNHAGNNEISKYPMFVAMIKRLEREGFKVGIHGYTHIGDEFNCNSSVAEEKIKLATIALKKANISFERIFVPPRYSISKEALNVLLKDNFTVILRDRIYYPNGTCIKVKNREYTWYASNFTLGIRLIIAKFEFRKNKENFILSLHPKAANYGCGLEFLRRFLEFVKSLG
ncbi:DUF2334 domain-containing protein [Pyrococcus sp. ST04]|uniref:DUF2334 domain-containing protein n=1 Tax=Pyrococcus sp. ST04 TaxID=1183377 RepID=UPI00026058C3|nr:DUF2334 domain-containing protein [Pyrococcus sp. ST04]AFK21656.1 putative polysaccharide deacetylase [Pyrococcus sp. ST04]